VLPDWQRSFESFNFPVLSLVINHKMRVETFKPTQLLINAENLLRCLVTNIQQNASYYTCWPDFGWKT